MKWQKIVDWIAGTLVIVSAIHVGLVEFFDFDIVLKLATSIRWFWIEPTIKGLIGVSGIYVAVQSFRGKFMKNK